MARNKNSNRDKAFELYKKHNGNINLVKIASQLNIPEGTVRSWKSRYKWDNEINATLQNSKRNVARKKGGQPNNKNSVGHGAPKENKNAEKYGFFSKYLPPETKEIFDAVAQADPLDLLWHQIQLAYVAIVRAQQIAYVKNHEDSTTTKIAQGYSESGSSEKWEVQQAWDKQANFMKAQARAQGELRSMIKQYDEMLHNSWELASEEQKSRIALLKSKVNADNESAEGDDGFLEALEGKVDEIWQEE